MIDKFYPKIRDNGSDGHEITIPKKIIDGNDFKTGDQIICWIKKDTNDLPTEHTTLNQEPKIIADKTSEVLKKLPTTKSENEHFFTTPRKLKTKIEENE